MSSNNTQRRTYVIEKQVINWIEEFSDESGLEKSEIVNRACKFYATRGVRDERDPIITDPIDKEFSKLVDDLGGDDATEESNQGNSFWEELERELGIEYDEEEDQLSIPDPPKKSLPEFVEFMFERGYMNEEHVPYEPYKEQETNRKLIKSERFGHTPHKIRDNVWIDSRHSRKYAERYIREMCHKFGLNNEDYQPV